MTDRLEELAALHALGLLDETAQADLLKALATDAEADKLLRDYLDTAAGLALDVPQVGPPPTIKREILRQLPARAGSNILPFSTWLPYAIAACLLSLAVYQTWRNSVLKHELADAQATLKNFQWQISDNAERKAFADLRVVPIDPKDPAYLSASLIVAWDNSLHQGVITVQNLPLAPAGHDYQLWVLDPHEAAPVNAGLLTPGPSRRFTVPPLATSAPGFAVSLEPTGGSPAPTGPILFAVAPIE